MESIDYLERLKRKIEIIGRISDLRGEISEVENIKSSMMTIKKQINTEQDNWTSKLREYNELELSPEINMKDNFEGLAAQQLAIDFPIHVVEINTINGQMSGVMCAIDDQISKIDEYIEKINEEIRSLQSELDSL